MKESNITLKEMRDIMRHNKNLSGLDLTHLDWKRVNLAGANLSGSKLGREGLPNRPTWYQKIWTIGQRYNSRRVVLTEAHLNRADLRFADLSHADMRGCLLKGANLSYANLFLANLRLANLTDANLCGTNLLEADLRGAILTNVKYDDSTVWPNKFDFSQVRMNYQPARQAQGETTIT